MNSYKLNSLSNYILRKVISETLKIHIADVYRAVKEIENGIVYTADGKTYKIELKEIK